MAYYLKNIPNLPRFTVLFGCFLLYTLSLRAQGPSQEEIKNVSNEAIEAIYNLNFPKAESLIKKLEVNHAKHPVTPFLRAYLLSWQDFPMAKNKAKYNHYIQYLNLTLVYANKLVERNPKSYEGIFFQMMVHGLKALYEAESGDYVEAASYGKKSFTYIKKGFDLTREFPDFHFSTGLYKYYAEQYPEIHPVVKPFMVFFPDGDKQAGLKHLVLATQQGKFSQVEALIYLTDIYNKYEQNYLSGLQCSQDLLKLYPQNPFFATKYAESLIHVGRFAEAELGLAKFASKSGVVYQIAQNLFQGLLKERYYKQNTAAAGFYQKVISYKEYDPRYSQDYVAMAHAGLARLAKARGDEKTAKNHYKKALKLSESIAVIEEAKAFLK